jgi:hypothetical protein
MIFIIAQINDNRHKPTRNVNSSSLSKYHTFVKCWVVTTTEISHNKFDKTIHTIYKLVYNCQNFNELDLHLLYILNAKLKISKPHSHKYRFK